MSCLFLHIPKTGGATVRKILEGLARHFPIQTEHLLFKKWHIGVDEDKNNSSFITNLRDPVEWYKSWVRYWYWRGYDPYFMAISKNKTLNYEDTILNALIYSEEVGLEIDRLMILHNGKRDGSNISLEAPSSYAWDKLKGGFYSLLCNRMLTHNWYEYIFLNELPDHSRIIAHIKPDSRDTVFELLRLNDIKITLPMHSFISNYKDENKSKSENFELSKDTINKIFKSEEMIYDWINNGIS